MRACICNLAAKASASRATALKPPGKPPSLPSVSSSVSSALQEAEEKKKSKSKAAGAVDLKPPVARKMPVCKLSPALSDVLEVSEATRTDALKKIWEYIKANKLQNAENKKEILCDEKLKKVFVHDKITIHEVVKSMSPHISKKNE